MNQATEIVTEDFTEDFVDLRRLMFAAETFTKLALYQAVPLKSFLTTK